MITKGLVSTGHPVMAHIIPIRRCNLSCAYCNEYDDHSKPVPIATLGALQPPPFTFLPPIGRFGISPSSDL